jgi:hypothetical protein
MVLDRRTTHGLVQALIHARNRKDGGDPLAQASTASLGRSYGRPIFAETRFSSASQPGVTTGDRAASQSHKPVLTPRPYPFRDQAGEVADMAKDRSNPAGEVLRPNMAQATSHSNVRPVTQATTPGYRSADGVSPWATEATHRGSKLPRVRYPTSGEIWSEFLGGIGKGVAQTLADIVAEDAKHRQAMVDGIYIDSPNPDLFEPPTSPWDYTGREIAPGVMVTTRPVKQKPKTWYDKKIGKVEPPEHLKPGTGPFGDDMHEKIARFLEDSFPEARFDVRVKRGRKGVDLTRIEGTDRVDKYWEISTNEPWSIGKVKRQIQKWGYDEPSVRAISYDEYGNIYDGFGR